MSLTIPEIRAVLERVDFGFPFKAWEMKATLVPEGDHPEADYVSLRLFMRSPERDTGVPGPLNFQSAAVPRDFFHDEAKVVTWARLTARFFVCHELDEAIVFDGKRPFDPHVYQDPYAPPLAPTVPSILPAEGS